MSEQIFAGFIQQEILYETSEYSPGHQRQLGEANKTNIKDPPLDACSMVASQLTPVGPGRELVAD